jgi:CheY-like chemotaxis protein
VGDPDRLRQVIVNLVGNAIKFTETGEVVGDVRIESRQDHEIELHFTVTDTGIGIPKEKQQAIFEMFEQADPELKRLYGGTGLGLAISSGLVSLMGGRIWVESEVDHGSTFHFTGRFGVPRDGPSTARLTHPDLIHNMRVFVVDDNATNCRILEEVLRSWTMRPATVSAAAEAVDVLCEAMPASRNRLAMAHRVTVISAYRPAKSIGNRFNNAISRSPGKFRKATTVNRVTSVARPKAEE